ncbi:MAG: 16S rRNA (cytosine(967)-C(5))-methyltransferase RsmB [Eubacterium sp.]
MTNSPNNQINLRNLVLEMFLETEQGRKSHIVLKDNLDRHRELDKQQRAFVTRLYQGTVERRIEMDYIINQFSKTPVKKLKPVIREILRMSVYQIKYMDSVPVSAACNEAVKLAVKRKFANLKGFVNGVIRNIARNIDHIDYPKELLDKLSVVYSVPRWIIEMWNQEYGQETTEEMLKGLYDDRSTTVRCNPSKAKVEDIIASLQYKNIKVEKSDLYDNALFISEYDRLSSLDVFQAGMITVQDLSSMMAGIAANPKKGDYIIDVCAAPGGKSLHMAELMDGTGMVEARDLTEYKVNLIKENNRRMRYRNIKAVVKDATEPDLESVEKADIVMADLPCSGLGVIGNKSDIKYNISRQQINELVQFQRKILKIVSTYVKPGGRLIFSTCTVNKSENQGNVKWIEENLPFKLVSLEGILPEQLDGKDGCLQIFPGQYGMDGFFISSFIRE